MSLESLTKVWVQTLGERKEEKSKMGGKCEEWAKNRDLIPHFCVQQDAC
jgi:hypothetical protein